MATLKHKFYQKDFENGFKTNSSILETKLYKPEVLFIGTFNHGWTWNSGDFYYGRGMYMWTVLANLFLYNNNVLIRQRTAKNNNPTTEQLFEICEKGKIVFADIVKGVKEEISTLDMGNHVIVNGEYYWGTQAKIGEYSDVHLDNMGNKGWLDDNLEAIIKYINDNPTIKNIYFTFKSGTWIKSKIEEICSKLPKEVSACSLFTPTANGFGKNLNKPYHERAWSLAHTWVWNGLENEYMIKKPDFGHLNHEWLIKNGVNPNNF